MKRIFSKFLLVALSLCIAVGVNAQVSFKEIGSAKQIAPITLLQKDMKPIQPQKMVVKKAKPSGKYAGSKLTAVKADATWTSVGSGAFTDSCLAVLYGATQSFTYDIEVERCVEDTNLYRLVEPFGSAHPKYSTLKGVGTYTTGVSVIVDASNPENVTIAKQKTGWADIEGDLYLEATGGKLVRGVVTFAAANVKLIQGEEKYTGNISLTLPNLVPAAWTAWEPFTPGGSQLAKYVYTAYATGEQDSLNVYVRTSTTDANQKQIKVANWGHGVFTTEGIDFIVDWNSATDSCRVAAQNTGYTSSYGLIYLMDYGVFLNNDLYMPYYPCTYNSETGVFTLNLGYTPQSYIGTGSGWPGVEQIRMHGFTDYTIASSALGSFTEDVTAGTGTQYFSATSQDATKFRFKMVSNAEITTLADIDSIARSLEGDFVNFETEQSVTATTEGYYYIVIASYKDTEEYAGYAYQGFYFSPSSNWTVLGNGSYTEDLVASMYSSISNVTFDVEVQESKQYAGLYRIKNPYANWPYAGTEGVALRGDVYWYINATNPSQVSLGYPTTLQALGVQVNGDEFASYQSKSYGTLANDSITFPTNGIYVAIVGEDGAYYGNAHGAFCLTIPQQPEGPGSWTNAETLELGKSYYIYNENEGEFLKGGNDWGTQASIGVDAYPFYIESIDSLAGTYVLAGPASNGGVKNHLGSNLYIDAVAYGWQIVKGENGFYTISNGTKFLGSNGTRGSVTGELIVQTLDAADSTCYWRFVEVNQAKVDLQQGFMDATCTVQASNFGRNDLRNPKGSKTAWTLTTVGGNGGALGGDNANNCFEVWNSAASTFDVKQTLTDMPNGVYRMYVQGYYRQGGVNDDYNALINGEAIDVPVYFYANDTKASFTSIRTDLGAVAEGVSTALGLYPDNLSQASHYFSKNAYNNVLYFTVTDNTINLGFSKNGNGVAYDWFVADNIQLTYFDANSDIAALQETDTVYQSMLKKNKADNDSVLKYVAAKMQSLIDGIQMANATGGDITALQKAIDDAKEVMKNPTSREQIVAARDALTAAIAKVEWGHRPIDGVYYIYDAQDDLFLTRGAYWGTCAALDHYGWPVALSTTSNLETVLRSADWQSYSLSTDDATAANVYWDNANTVNNKFSFELVNPDSLGAGFYLKNIAAAKYMAKGETVLNDSPVFALTATTTEGSPLLTVMTPSEYELFIASRQAAKSVEVMGDVTIPYSSKDVTNKVQNAALAGNYTGWQWTAQSQRGGTLATNTNGTECFQGCGVLSQTITGMTPGIYAMTLNGFVRANGDLAQLVKWSKEGINPVDAYIDMNGSVSRFRAFGEGATDDGQGNVWPNTMAEASEAFDQGNYVCAVMAKVGADSTLTIKLVQPTWNSQCWWMFKGLVLKQFIPISEDTTSKLIVSEEASKDMDPTESWYLLKQKRGSLTPVYDTENGNQLKRAATDCVKTGALLHDNLQYLVRFLPSTENEGAYKIQFATGQYFGADLTSAATGGDFNVYKINGTDGHFGINKYNMGLQVDNNGNGSTVAYWATGEVKSLNGNTDWWIYDVHIEQPTATDDELATLVDSIQKAYNADKAEMTKELISESTQFSSPYSQNELGTLTDGGGFETLIDGDVDTYWHSYWEGGAVELGTHYIEVALPDAQEGDFIINIQRRYTWNSHVTLFGVSGSNDKDQWEEIGDVSLPYGSYGEKVSGSFTTDSAYQYYRFYCKGTNNGDGFFHLAEFQLSHINTESSLYQKLNDATTAYVVSDLEKALETGKTTFPATQEAIDNLKAAYANYLEPAHWYNVTVISQTGKYFEGKDAAISDEDGAVIAQALELDETSEVKIYAVIDGKLDGTNNGRGETDGWRNAEGGWAFFGAEGCTFYSQPYAEIYDNVWYFGSSMGAYPDAVTAANTYSTDFVFENPANNKRARATFNLQYVVLPSPSYVVEVESYLNSSYEGIPAAIADSCVTEILEELGIEDIKTAQFANYAIYPDATTDSTAFGRGATDGWRDAEGYAAYWDNGSVFYSQPYAEFNEDSTALYLGSYMGGMPGQTAEKASYSALHYFVNKATGAKVTVEFILSYVERPAVDVTEVGSEEVTYNIPLKAENYDNTAKTLDFEDALDAIGCDLADAAIYGKNLNPVAYLAGAMETYDGWHDGETGNFMTWSDIAASESKNGICVKMTKDATDNINICVFPGNQLDVSKTYKVAWTLVNPLNGNGYTFNINLKDDGTGINDIDANANANANVIFDLSGRKVTKVTTKGIYIVNGKKVLR